jgi:hypothetical protein
MVRVSVYGLLEASKLDESAVTQKLAISLRAIPPRLAGVTASQGAVDEIVDASNDPKTPLFVRETVCGRDTPWP